MQIATIILEALTPNHVKQAWFKSLIKSIWDKRGDWIYDQVIEETTVTTPCWYFLVKLRGEIIGFTGYYEYDQENVGLCWHGLIPSARGHGYSKHIFERIRNQAKQTYPQATGMVELIPSDRASELVGHFESLGFVPTTEDVDHLWLPPGPTWRLYRAPL